MSASFKTVTCTAVVLALALTACASAQPVLRTGADALPAAWSRGHVAGAAISEHHAEGGTIAASISCDAVDEDAPLDVLVNHVLLQLDGAVEQSRKPITLDGRAGLRVRLAVKLDGVPVALDLVVFKKDGCVVDAQLAAEEQTLPLRVVDFDRFVASLAVERRTR
jgi:hypothetical protein